jgi:hypothetical protein
MQGWVNMGLDGSLGVKLKAWTDYQIPSFFGGLDDIGQPAPGEYNADAIFMHQALAPGWEAKLENLTKVQILPNFGKGKV